MNQIRKELVLLILLVLISGCSSVKNTSIQSSKDTIEVNKDTLSKFERYSQKGEALFKILPVPVLAYSTESGTIFGLAKYNLLNLVKSDTISHDSKFDALVSYATKGQYKGVISGDMFFNENKLNVTAGVRYIKFPSFIFGVGNTISEDNIESVITESFEFDIGVLRSINQKKTLYAGALVQFKNYTAIDTEPDSFITRTNYPGVDGGVSSGLGLGIIYDTRDFRFNAKNGFYLKTNFFLFNKAFGSDYKYNSFELDIRKYFNPWLEHVIALQVYTQANSGNVPFYSLALLGGDQRMRGYYKGALRDKVIGDAQIEYRLPIWSIFGATAFASAGRVSADYKSFDFNNLRYGAGIGLRVLLDKKNRGNLRFDFGYGAGDAQTFSIGFTEAF
ncbi:BamA/TamA family outer membrane protein [uncultured Lacinutrix sp.]|uniref:BamA/TamA family outer membrane protein n=1 Tax=uncultured Lacinutrix sp. TaxID=574032 RepID=UPI0026223D04|nr:BamA/TamA family outer membrane protein [uncultured Lacinutrix sp.]